LDGCFSKGRIKIVFHGLDQVVFQGTDYLFFMDLISYYSSVILLFFACFDNTKKYQQAVEKNRTVYCSVVELSVNACREAPTEIYEKGKK